MKIRSPNEGGPQLTKQSVACTRAVRMQQTHPPHQSPQYLPLVCGKFRHGPWISRGKFHGQFETQSFPHEVDYP